MQQYPQNVGGRTRTQRNAENEASASEPTTSHQRLLLGTFSFISNLLM